MTRVKEKKNRSQGEEEQESRRHRQEPRRHFYLNASLPPVLIS
jgi:hypothetical protein